MAALGAKTRSTISTMISCRRLAPLFVAVAVAGCSTDAPKATDETTTKRGDAAPANGTAPQPVYLTTADREAQKVGTPQRAVIDFWSTVQNRDLLAAYDMLTADFKRQFAPTLRKFGTFIIADHPHWLVKPKVLSAETDSAVSSVVVTYPIPGGNAPRETFSLVRDSGQWRIRYNFYLVNRLTAQ